MRLQGQYIADIFLDPVKIAVSSVDALGDLGQKCQLATALGNRFQQVVECINGVMFKIGTTQVCELAGCQIGGQPLPQAAKVFNQDNPQGGWQGP